MGHFEIRRVAMLADEELEGIVLPERLWGNPEMLEDSKME